MLTEGHRYWEGLACLHRLFIVHFAVLAWRDVEPHFVLFLQHDTVTSDVLDSGFRIAGNDKMGRAQIASAVARMPARYRKLHKIDLVAPLDVLKHRTRRNDVGFDRLHGAQAC